LNGFLKKTNLKKPVFSHKQFAQSKFV